jgi:hypothetical protein
MKAVAGARAAGLPSFYVEALEVLS